jgi:hypothetical protein
MTRIERKILGVDVIDDTSRGRGDRDRTRFSAEL